MDSSDTWFFVKLISGCLLAIVILASAFVAVGHRWEQRQCARFCADFGETSYYSPAYGCHCVTPDGKRYNPNYVSKD